MSDVIDGIKHNKMSYIRLTKTHFRVFKLMYKHLLYFKCIYFLFTVSFTSAVINFIFFLII